MYIYLQSIPDWIGFALLTSLPIFTVVPTANGIESPSYLTAPYFLGISCRPNTHTHTIYFHSFMHALYVSHKLMWTYEFCCIRVPKFNWIGKFRNWIGREMASYSLLQATHTHPPWVTHVYIVHNLLTLRLRSSIVVVAQNPCNSCS